MKLGLSIGYSRAQLEIPVKLVQRAEELGYDSVWTAEAYGTDAVGGVVRVHRIFVIASFFQVGNEDGPDAGAANRSG